MHGDEVVWGIRRGGRGCGDAGCKGVGVWGPGVWGEGVAGELRVCGG